MSPSQYLTFPLLHTPNLSNGVSSQKGPGILNSKALGLLRRAQSSQSRKEAGSDGLPQQLLSSWHVAPVHLPLLGQNCWPHLSEGFSVSLWFSVEHIPKAESAVEKGKKIKRRNKSLTLQDGSLDDTGMVFLLSVVCFAELLHMAFGWSYKDTGTFSLAVNLFFVLSALVMAGPGSPKPGLPDGLFCTLALGLEVGAAAEGPPCVQLLWGVTSPISCLSPGLITGLGWFLVWEMQRKQTESHPAVLLAPSPQAPGAPLSSPFSRLAQLSSSFSSSFSIVLHCSPSFRRVLSWFLSNPIWMSQLFSTVRILSILVLSITDPIAVLPPQNCVSFLIWRGQEEPVY